MKYCTRCLYPENHPYGLIFDENGVCSGCIVHEEKDVIDWDKKFKKLKNIEDRYLFGKTLGQGAFGTVKLCMHKDSQKTFAIKIMHKVAIKK